MSELNDDSLPDDFDPMDQLARSEQTIKVTIDTRSFGKEMTVVEGFGDDVEIDELSSTLKSKLACGGTAKNGQIQLQGNHLRRIEEVLENEGFNKENIDVNR